MGVGLGLESVVPDEAGQVVLLAINQKLGKSEIIRPEALALKSAP